MADKPDAFPGPKGQIHRIDGELPPVETRDGAENDSIPVDQFMSHGVSRSSDAGRVGCIKGAVSITPPG